MNKTIKKWVAVSAAAVAAITMSAGILAGCSNNNDDQNDDGTNNAGNGTTTYTYAYKAIAGNTYEAAPYNFSKDVTMAWRALDITLELKDDGTFSMSTNVYMVEDTEGSSIAVGEKFPFGDGMYQESFTEATGTWTQGEGTVTIKADWVKYKLPDQGSSYFVFNPMNMGYNDMTVSDTYVGEWDSTQVAAVKDLVPDTTFFVSGTTINGFVKAGYSHSVVTSAAALYFYEDSVYLRDISGKKGGSYSYSVSGNELTLSQTTMVSDGDGGYVPQVTEYKANAGGNLTIGNVTIAISADDITAIAAIGA